MPTLNQTQKDQLKRIEPNKSADYILNQIQKYDNLSLDDFPDMDASKRKYIKNKLDSIPNPNEQQEWAEISTMLGSPSQELLDKLKTYIKNWESSRPAGNHVDEAWNEYHRVENALSAIQREQEENDWNNVDTLSEDSLIGHLRKYPNTVHKEEIDDCYWGLVDKENIQEIQDYQQTFQTGMHKDEARVILNAIVTWNNVKNTNDIFAVHDYICQNPSTPFKNQADLLLLRLKQVEINAIKNSPNNYDVFRLKELIEKDIISKNELINAKVLTSDILNKIMDPNPNFDLPDIKQAIKSSHAECKEDFTDVFFFGIPSTGKTCVLMGLSRSDSLNINLAAGGGDYAAVLQQFTKAGVTPPPTPGNFVTTLEATIRKPKSSGIKHKVNLVEMSGEEFAFEIANNNDHVYSFEYMGSGTTELLNNNNRKVFFLIIDPTADIIHFNREIDEYDELTGEKKGKRLESFVVNQNILIQKMVSLFKHPSNEKIMKKVDSLHIIMTKADLLGSATERENKAKYLFNQHYSGDILDNLIELCSDCNINSNTNFHPKLYLFSLGQFYVGGYYQYDKSDSNNLVRAITNSTHGTRKKTFWEKIKEVMNYSLF